MSKLKLLCSIESKVNQKLSSWTEWKIRCLEKCFALNGDCWKINLKFWKEINLFPLNTCFSILSGLKLRPYLKSIHRMKTDYFFY